ncbi:hypothetical protein KGF42_10515 [Clostridioides sp. ZZV15-6383]|uniref:hypothetical protein n=1 Tax=Clostridioides sp. ZZV15-6383 TaxID=2811498 RepID=UPI001D0F5D19|nr:hypothetical protein [Clostridioides sp. ZZV15-6383]
MSDKYKKIIDPFYKIREQEERRKRLFINPAEIIIKSSFKNNIVHNMNLSQITQINIPKPELISIGNQGKFIDHMNSFEQVSQIIRSNEFNINQILKPAISTIYETNQLFLDSITSSEIFSGNLSNSINYSIKNNIYGFVQLTESIMNKFQSYDIESVYLDQDVILDSFNGIIDNATESGDIDTEISNILKKLLSKLQSAECKEKIKQFAITLFIPLAFNAYFSITSGNILDKIYEEERNKTELLQDILDETKANRKTNEAILEHLKKIDENFKLENN